MFAGLVDTAQQILRRRIEPRVDHRKLLIKMTSLLSLPRVNARHLPSRDQSKLEVIPDSNFVICVGGPPVSLGCQMLVTPAPQ